MRRYVLVLWRHLDELYACGVRQGLWRRELNDWVGGLRDRRKLLSSHSDIWGGANESIYSVDVRKAVVDLPPLQFL